MSVLCCQCNWKLRIKLVKINRKITFKVEPDVSYKGRVSQDFRPQCFHLSKSLGPAPLLSINYCIWPKRNRTARSLKDTFA